LHHYGISTRLTACHEHNERNKTRNLLRLLQQGKCIALISDAGTPLVSDPGYKLVHAAIENGIRVIPVPGACAAIAALSAAGLPTDSFSFEGFAPAKKGARTKFFEERKHETRTLIFYEASHRIMASVDDMATIFGPTRKAAIARELTKTFETIRYGTLGALCEEAVWRDPKHLRGEFVVVVEGSRPNKVPSALDPEVQRIVRILLRQLSTKQVAALAAEITGVRKHEIYRFAVSAKDT
jgi:16S rRNA (cytidine1402-2'-O)-methyltransferase